MRFEYFGSAFFNSKFAARLKSSEWTVFIELEQSKKIQNDKLIRNMNIKTETINFI